MRGRSESFEVAHPEGHLPVLPRDTPIEYVGQISIHYPLLILAAPVWYSIASEILVDAPLQDLKEAFPIEIRHIHQIHYVIYQLRLDHIIEYGVPGERGARVDFDEPALQVGVNKDVIAEELKGARIVLHVILACNQGFDDDLANLRPDGFFPGHTGGLVDTLFQGRERDLCTTIESILRTLLALLILIVLGAIVLLNGHISQVYVLVILVSRVQTERDCGETTESVSIQESLQRIDRGDHHIDTHVKLVPIDQKRVLDVLLHHYRLSIGDL